MALTSRMPSLESLGILLAVARRGSLTGAAREVGVSEQAISARITSLEAQTGLSLVVRGRQGTTLTRVGMDVVRSAEALLSAARRVDDDLATLRNDRRRRLRVSASFTIGEQLLPRWLAAMQRDALDRGASPLDIRFDSSNWTTVIARVADGSADIGFVGGPTLPDGIRSKVVAVDKLMMVVSPSHPWAGEGRTLVAEDLQQIALIAREEGSGQWETIKSAFATAVGKDAQLAEPTMVLPSTSAVLAAVRAGGGPAILSSLAVANDIRDGRLCRIRLTGINLRRSLRAIWLGPKVPPSGAVRDFLAFVVAHPVNTSL